MALNEKLNQRPGPEKKWGEPKGKGRREIIPFISVAALTAAGGAALITPQREVHAQGPTTEPSPTPSEPGAIIPGVESGETLAMGGVNWNIRSFETKKIAQLLGKEFLGWKIIKDPTTHSIFNLISTDQKGRYFLILPHAPNTHQWDRQNKIWVDSQNPKAILFPQVALPGGWNEAKKLAGPTVIPDIAIMLKNPDGKIQVGVIYKKDVLAKAGINPESNPDSYRSLSDGYLLFLGEQKNLTLQEGQTIEAVFDKDGNLLYHQIINPDGTWFKVLTSWDQVKNAEQVKHMFKPIGIQIGDEITKIPYASEEMIEKVGISEYGKLKDGTYVAYKTVTDKKTSQTKKLVVAKAVFTTNKEGKKVFKEWQETVPLEDRAVVHPRITNPELFDLTKQEAPIPQFANALKNAGIKLSPEQIAQGITYVSTKKDGTPLVDKDGNPFVVAVYNLDPSLFPKKYRSLAGPIPLMIAERGENGEWRCESNTLLKDLEEKSQITMGLSSSITNISRLRSIDPKSRKILDEDFNQTVLADALWHIPYDENKSLYPSRDRININPLIQAVASVRENNKIMVFHLVWGSYNVLPQWLLTGNYDKTELMQIMKNYISNVITPLRGKVNKWVVVNEPFGAPWSPRDSKFWHDRLGPNPDWIKEAFRTAHNADPDAQLILNDFGIEIPGERLYNAKKAETIFKLAKEMHNEGLPIAIGFQMHLYGQDMQTSDQIEIMSNNLRNNIRRYKEAGIPVIITEFDVRLNGVSGTQEERMLKQARIYYKLTRIALEEGVEINFFGDIDAHSWLEDPNINGPDAHNADPTLRNDDYQRKFAWYSVAKAIFEYLISNSN